MIETHQVPAPVEQPRPAGGSQVPAAFAAILRRDLVVTMRELPTFLAQVIIQPLFLLFVFGKILTELGYAQPGYAHLLFPGIVAMTAVLTAIQATALPLVIEFSFTMEIEDRLLAPLSTNLVALEKVLFAALRGLVAAAVMFPLGILILGSIPWHASALPEVIAVIVLGSLAGASMGLVLGTLVAPAKISLIFALVLTPLIFTGSSQYPWRSLSRLRWFQVVAALNPLTYVSEGLRGALVPSVPHIAGWLCLSVLVAAVVGLVIWGMQGFRRRAIS